MFQSTAGSRPIWSPENISPPPAPLSTFSLSEHKVIKTEDVLYEIFRALEPRHSVSAVEIRTNRIALARAARTCKAFRQPALDVLWSYQDSLAPLFRLLGSAFTVIAGGPNQYYSDVRGPIDENRWNSFLNRARCVRTLSIPTGHFICRHAFTRVLQKAGGPIFVNLRTLSTSVTVESDLELSLISIHRLPRIEINSITDSTISIVESLCTDLEESPQHILNLSLSGASSSPVTPCMLGSIRQLAWLTSLKMTGGFVAIDREFLAHLGTLQFLSHLDIQCILIRRLAYSWRNIGPGAFPSLSDFKLATSDTSLVGQFFTGIGPSNELLHIHIILQVGENSDTLEKVLNVTFKNATFGSNLLTFRYTELAQNDAARSKREIKYDHLTSSLSHYSGDRLMRAQLQCLEIDSSRYFAGSSWQTLVTDQDSELCANTLTTLALPLVVPSRYPMGLQELTAIVLKHPKLTSLQVYISPRESFFPTQLPNPNLQCPMKTLSLGSAVVFESMDEAISIAEYIDCLCPNLTSLVGADDEPPVAGWGQVWKLIQSYRRNRALYST